MNMLLIDSTADNLIVIGDNGKERVSEIGDSGARRHTGVILVSVDEVLKKLNVKPQELDALAVVVGPGSFTGIRIGVATANAMAFATGAKLVELTSLESYALDMDDALVLLDCKHDNYYALIKKDGASEYAAINASEIEGFGLPVIYAGEADCERLMRAFEDKLNRGETVATAKSFYIKKSSAEI